MALKQFESELSSSAFLFSFSSFYYYFLFWSYHVLARAMMMPDVVNDVAQP